MLFVGPSATYTWWPLGVVYVLRYKDGIMLCMLWCRNTLSQSLRFQTLEFLCQFCIYRGFTCQIVRCLSCYCRSRDLVLSVSPAASASSLQEDRTPGHVVLDLEMSDADLDPNGAPFTFDIIAGNDGNAFLVTNNGTVATTTTFDRNVKDMYDRDW